MKVIAVFACLVAVALAAPQQDSKDATILKYNNDNIGVDGYNFDFETSDGISRQETGELKNAGSENEAIDVKGTYTYQVGGKTVTVTFVADENGYRPKTSISRK